MYYPLLRAKQYDLKAIREFAEEHIGQKKILPIIEPVNAQNNALILAINALISVNQKFALVLNPQDGEYRYRTVSFSLLDELPALLEEHRDKWIPAFMCNGNVDMVSQQLEDGGYNHAMLIHPSGLNVEDEAIMTLCSNPHVDYIVNNFGSSIARRTGRLLRETGKNLIRLDDLFNSQHRNADYLNCVDELFSEEWYYYAEEDLHGFSDYTSVQKELTDGGSLPYALAIHLTYRHSEDQVYIHHFVSDSNKTQQDVRGKFCEAAIKIRDFFASRADRTTPIDDLISRSVSREGYPGLGYLKKVSIKNHLELMHSIL